MSLYTELYDLQGGRCGICGTDESLVIDHDHRTGFVRGLLCRGCNNAEGQHNHCTRPDEHCPTCLWRRTPAVCWLGRTERYNGIFGDAEGLWDGPWLTKLEMVEVYAERFRRTAPLIEGLYADEWSA
jgi:hypothetical protein